MKRYFLLRDNREAGPFTLRELKSMNLLTNDLVWVEGESTCWSYPGEIEELLEIKLEPGTPASAGNKRVPLFSDPSLLSTIEKERPVQPADPLPKPSFEKLARKIAEKTPQRRVRIQPAKVGAGVFGLVVLTLGVLMIGMMAKDVVNKFRFPEPLATAEAQEINGEKLVQNSSTHAAFATVANPAAQHADLVLSPDMPPQIDSLSLPPVDETMPVVKKEAPRKVVEKPAEKTDATNNGASAVTAANETGDAKEASSADLAKADATNEDKTETEKKETPAKLQVSANEYKTGFLGGISDLQLTVKNPSAKAVERATIAVEYLKPNGKVVHTQTVEVAGLDAGESKKVEVPNSSRGVSVRYHVVNR